VGWRPVIEERAAKGTFRIEENFHEPGMRLMEAEVNGARFGSLTTGGCRNQQCQVVRTVGEDLVIEPYATDGRTGDCEIVEIDDKAKRGTFTLSTHAMPCSTDNGSEVTAVVFFTNEAEIEAGGGKEIDTRIAFAAGATNEALKRSGVPTSLKVLRTEKLAISNTASPPDLRAHVEQHDLRGNADIVVLISTGLDQCGKAYRQGSKGIEGHRFAPFAYAVVRNNCLSCGNWSFGHEIGHLMGACHESGEPCINNPFTSNFEFIDETNMFKTLSSRMDACAPCVRINQWSSNTIRCDSLPTGTPKENNAQRLRDTMLATAKFRCTNP
jgi:hypothetical protein